ncbi:MAG: hypothetical protein R3A50_04140 [Saprospiraceae bacterium]
MTLHASGIRDISQVLGLCASSVVDILRRHAKKIKEPCFEGHFEAVEVEVNSGLLWINEKNKNDGVGMFGLEKERKY